MLFSSIDFAIFLPIVFILYWFVFNKNLKAQNLLILVASYFFYGWWDWRFLSLIVFSSIIDYSVGVGLANSNSNIKRKLLLTISILINIGFLGFFKYTNFFLDSFANAFSFMGRPIQVQRLNIILPVGISFYTFQTLSYSIDVYKRKLEPTRDIIAFFAFVSFFPQLVAGPIERATNLLPTFYKKRNFDYSKAVDGARQIMWGLFKKMVIADNCAIFVNDIYANYADYPGSTLMIGSIFFAFQLYGDFSGYSDIAIGTSRLFGFSLMQNFAYPYFSRDIAEFYRRWHISLSTWFRDYLYIPIGGSRVGTWGKIRNTFVIYLVSGFWHGANWTFIFWGGINACYFLPLILLKRHRKHTNIVAEGRIFPNLREAWQIGFTFFIALIARVFFRAETLGQAFGFLKGMFNSSLFSIPYIPSPRIDAVYTFILIVILNIFEWFQRDKKHGLEVDRLNTSTRWTIYIFVFLLIFCFSITTSQDFIYFQF